MDERARRIVDRAIGRGEVVPKDGDEQTLVEWLRAQTQESPAGRYITELWRERADLQDLLPGIHLDRGQRDRLLLWAHHFAANDCAAPAELVPDSPSTVSDLAPEEAAGPAPALEPGVTVVGYLRAVLGLGAAARRLVQVCRLAGEPVSAIPYDHINSPLDHPFDSDRYAPAGSKDPFDRPEPPAYDVTILCVNGAETPQLARAIGARNMHGRYRIGLWFWELDTFPDEMAAGLRSVDEVWVTSEFVRDAIRTKAPEDFPIFVIPLGADYPDSDADRGIGISRSQLGLPEDATIVGFTFDHASRLTRKNALGLIAAFEAAFPMPSEVPSEAPEQTITSITPPPVLVLKTLNADRFPEDAAILREAIAARSDMLLIERQYSFAEQRAFVREIDVLVSLHRSEGYGYILLEAMGLGTPVIATGYSGNLAFMNPDNSWLIPHSMVQVGEGNGQYSPGGRWAEPDLVVAAQTIRSVVEKRLDAAVQQRCIRAAIEVAPVIDGRAGAEFVERRLRQIRDQRAGS